MLPPDREPRTRTAFFRALFDDRAPAAHFLLNVASGKHPSVTTQEEQLQWVEIIGRIDKLPVVTGEQVLKDFSKLLQGEVPNTDAGLSLLEAQVYLDLMEHPPTIPV